ncbi:MAG: SpoVR family protein [Gammaproteobacteria bacterium]|nr:SpoVR family protein [Gammaproteobacteria bacterium]
MEEPLHTYAEKLEALAHQQGLDYYPVDFETVPDSFMMEVAVYGLPVRMPHWSFGVRYIYQLVQHRMGHSRLFEVVFPGNPGRAYLANRNSVEENTLVTAHVLGHADFAKNNLLFKHSQQQVGYHIVEQAAAHARQIGDAMDAHGESRVEAILDAALALEQHIDIHKGLTRPLYPKYLPAGELDKGSTEFQSRFDQLPNDKHVEPEAKESQRAPIPPAAEYDLLWFIAQYAPELEDWERDIFLAVRKESFYFYPVFACQIMNEGWACQWHARLLRDADFLPQQVYLDAIKAHSDVVRPYAGDNQVALSINPYHLGFVLWEKIIEEKGMEEARKIMKEDDDFSFVRNHLNAELAEELGLFEYATKLSGEITVQESDIEGVRESLLATKFNFGAPRISVSQVQVDGTLELQHDHNTDGRGLDLPRAERVLEYIHRVWRRSVKLNTVDGDGVEKVLTIDPQPVPA